MIEAGGILLLLGGHRNKLGQFHCVGRVFPWVLIQNPSITALKLIRQLSMFDKNVGLSMRSRVEERIHGVRWSTKYEDNDEYNVSLQKVG